MLIFSCLVHPPPVPTGSPRNLQEASEKTSRTLTVEWEEVDEIDQNGEIIEYSIRYRDVDDVVDMTASVEAGVLYYNATDLTPGSVYNFRVAAVTGQGTGVYSDEIYPETLEERECGSQCYRIVWARTLVHITFLGPLLFDLPVLNRLG